MTFTERTLQIDIADAIGGRKFDGADHGLTCMKAVDFIVELEDRYLFIELKDPDDPEARQSVGTGSSRGCAVAVLTRV